VSDWVEIMEEMGRLYKEDARKRREHLEAVGIEKIIDEYDEGDFQFNILVDFLMMAKHYPHRFIDQAIALIEDPEHETHLSGFELVGKAKSRKAIPALLSAMESEYGWTVAAALRALLSIRSTRKDVREAIRNFQSGVKEYLCYCGEKYKDEGLLRTDEMNAENIDTLSQKLRQICEVK